MERRKFLQNSGMAAAAGLFTFSGNNQNEMTEKNIFIHHVYFWLKNPKSEEDRQALVKGLRDLSKIDYIKLVHIGVPADTNRDVIERSYAVSWLLFFKNKEDQDRYQTDPVHLHFIETCKHLWEKVVVYDSVDA
jgi:hypothetical protein